MPSFLAGIAERARLRVGSKLRGGKYVIDGLLGVGGMGIVYSATHRNGMRVALKMLHTDLAKDPVLRERFLREGYAANRVQHPGLVRILDDDVDDDGGPFLVMELLVGRTLQAAWDEAGATLPLPRVCSVALAILDVLAAVHAAGVVHRDVKPDNVFLTETGIKLLDLGIARIADSTLTGAGAQMGTPEFAAPEQAGGRVKEIDARSDVYSVGAIMFALLAGDYVHLAHSSVEAMIFAATRPARSLAVAWAEAPPEVVQLVDKALMFDKKARWANAEEMRDALADVMPYLPGQPLESATGPAHDRRAPPTIRGGARIDGKPPAKE